MGEDSSLAIQARFFSGERSFFYADAARYLGRESFFPERLRLLRRLEHVCKEYQLARKECTVLEQERVAEQGDFQKKSRLNSFFYGRELLVSGVAAMMLLAGAGLLAYALLLGAGSLVMQGGIVFMLGFALMAYRVHERLAGKRAAHDKLLSLQERSADAQKRREGLVKEAAEVFSQIQYWPVAAKLQSARILFAEASTVWRAADTTGTVYGPQEVLPRTMDTMSVESELALALHEVEEDSRREQAWISLLEERLARVRQAERNLIGAADALIVAEEDAQQAWNAWQVWLAERGLPAELSPKGTEDILMALREYALQGEKLARLDEQRKTLQDRLSLFISAVRHVAGLAQSCLKEEHSSLLHTLSLEKERDVEILLPEVLRLQDLLASLTEKAVRDEAAYVEKHSRLIASQEASAQAAEALQVTQRSLQALFASASVHDAEAYRLAFSKWSELASLLAEERRLHAGIESLASEEGVSLTEILASFEHTSQELLEETRQKMQSKLEFIEERLKGIAEEGGKIEERKTALSSDASASKLRTRQAGLEADLFRLSREWGVLALAKHLLLTAKSRYEKEGREGVLQFAGNIFQRVTDGEYSGIVADLEGESFLALHHTGERRDPERELSQGTREQLYLALRLAYVKNHGDKAEPLPMFMDEILVNFDGQRAWNTAKVLAEFAMENQILAFTCHPWLSDMLLQAASAGAGYPPAGFTVAKGCIARQ